jgi:hypothetical protein
LKLELVPRAARPGIAAGENWPVGDIKATLKGAAEQRGPIKASRVSQKPR